MSDTEPLERLCVHESIDEKVPIESFADALHDLRVPVEIVGDDASFDETDVVASYRPRDGFLDAGSVDHIDSRVISSDGDEPDGTSCGASSNRW
ncbi:hypothetical protein PM032_16445 [Halorubrum ezzemoulense]|uniref:hypothetical protein n=1 Tax=Halorubrum ezzemoulense TaxID=337243 RepID=UPI00232BAE05|nr:hypothetical protein [Halorubrum ezzemoulense]MDB2272584.1 hypothetical protein [Halorubrum ezzemoulense]